MSGSSCEEVENWSEFFVNLLLIGMFSVFVLFVLSPFIAAFLGLIFAIMGKFYMAFGAFGYAGLVSIGFMALGDSA